MDTVLNFLSKGVLTTGLPAAVSHIYAQYSKSTFKVLRYPSLSPEIGLAALGGGMAAVGSISGCLFKAAQTESTAKKFFKNIASPLVVFGALGVLSYSKKFVELTKRDAAVVFAVSCFVRLLLGGIQKEKTPEEAEKEIEGLREKIENMELNQVKEGS